MLISFLKTKMKVCYWALRTVLPLICSLISSCHHSNGIYIDNSDADTVKLQDLTHMQPLNLDAVITRVRYCFLNLKVKDDIHISKIVSLSGLLYLHDRSKSCLSIVDSTGTLKVTISNVQAFNLFHNKLYTYHSKKGLLSIYSTYGLLIKHIKIGFRGVDFANLNDSVLVFHTAGLLTADRESNHFELAFVKNTGSLLGFALPIPESKKGANYTASDRFSYNQTQLLFISALGNTVYEVNKQKLKASLCFDFGKFNLEDAVFETFKELEDYHFVPYVIDISNHFNTNKHSFFSFAAKGTEGYLLLDQKRHAVRFSGLSNEVSASTDFNNTIPLSYHNGELVCIIERKEFIDNYNLIKSQPGYWKRSKLSKLDHNKIARNNSPVLMFLKTEL